MDGPYLDKKIFLNTLGKDYLAAVFQITHKVTPSVQLFLNEQFGGHTGEEIEVFFGFLHHLKECNVPIHGVGIRGHNIFRTHNLGEYRWFPPRITDLGLLVEITEFDACIRLFEGSDDPYQAQKNYTTTSKIPLVPFTIRTKLILYMRETRPKLLSDIDFAS